MKTFLYKALALSFATVLFSSCEQETEAEIKPLASEAVKKFGTVPGATIIHFDEVTGFVNEVKVVKDSYTTLPVKISAKSFQSGRNTGGFVNGRSKANSAYVFDTYSPDKKNEGYKKVNQGPFQLGNVLTIGQQQGAGTTVNDKGGVIEMDFSSFGSVVMRGIYIADIEESERGSTLEMLDDNGNVIYTMELPVTGAYTFQPVVFGQGVSNVTKLRITIKSLNGKGGSGVIDVVQFCPGAVCYS